MIKCVGCKYSQGEFTPEGKSQALSFDNAILYCVSDEEKGTKGLMAYDVKLNRQKINLIGCNAFDELVDHVIEFTVTMGKRNGLMLPSITSVKLVK